MVDWIVNLSPQIATFLLAMLPITELRASIPIALGTFDISVTQIFFWSVLGNFVPVILILYLLEPISEYLSKKSKIIDRFFQWLFTRTRRRFENNYRLWGKIALLIFVAIPLPVTGAWTGATAAWLFGIRKREAMIYIGLGILLAGIIVTLISLGAFNIVDGLL